MSLFEEIEASCEILLFGDTREGTIALTGGFAGTKPGITTEQTFWEEISVFKQYFEGMSARSPAVMCHLYRRGAYTEPKIMGVLQSIPCKLLQKQNLQLEHHYVQT